MITVQNLRQSNLSLPPLTHQRVQELKQTPKGQRIMQEAFQAFPDLIKSLTNALQEKLDQYSSTRTLGADFSEGPTLETLVEEYQFLEFVQFVMFLKFKDEKNKEASGHTPGSLQANRA
ncbi:hypothetical protein CLV59_108315 [Chitinophaga dinghuensis]|uniref:Uncharacterized protein n=1 Tax=Chitinophaga dinghuensis TaxID=1539050 RepID=A0A327VQS7_9BACT|nr:hypothetical protein [Chitinophaga dinghuensis]RAJ76794.1 hypothetical protein CLV59_108315 [Chitinophaga dinghuensis]